MSAARSVGVADGYNFGLESKIISDFIWKVCYFMNTAKSLSSTFIWPFGLGGDNEYHS